MPLQKIITTPEGAQVGIWHVSESLGELEKSLPEEVKTKKYQRFNHELRKIEWLGARSLLRAMDLPLKIEYTEHGKPHYSKGPKISLTHSRDYVCIITHPSAEVGIDVQEIVEKVARIKNKFCNAEELNWASSIEDYTLIWSAKEALFKIKEKEVLFKEHMTVKPPVLASEIEVVFKEIENYIGRLEVLENYQLVYMVQP